MTESSRVGPVGLVPAQLKREKNLQKKKGRIALFFLNLAEIERTYLVLLEIRHLANNDILKGEEVNFTKTV